MRKQLLGFSFLFALISVSLFTSCSKDEVNTTDSEVIWNYTDEAMFSLQEKGNLGRNGCFELVFPITIAFPDLGENLFRGDGFTIVRHHHGMRVFFLTEVH